MAHDGVARRSKWERARAVPRLLGNHRFHTQNQNLREGKMEREEFEGEKKLDNDRAVV